jgi:hypothetical protein
MLILVKYACHTHKQVIPDAYANQVYYSVNNSINGTPAGGFSTAIT